MGPSRRICLPRRTIFLSSFPDSSLSAPLLPHRCRFLFPPAASTPPFLPSRLQELVLGRRPLAPLLPLASAPPPQRLSSTSPRGAAQASSRLVQSWRPCRWGLARRSSPPNWWMGAGSWREAKVGTGRGIQWHATPCPAARDSSPSGTRLLVEQRPADPLPPTAARACSSSLSSSPRGSALQRQVRVILIDIKLTHRC